MICFSFFLIHSFWVLISFVSRGCTLEFCEINMWMIKQVISVYDITEILLKVALNAIKQNIYQFNGKKYTIKLIYQRDIPV